MKKKLSLLLILVLVIGIIGGCGNNEKGNDSPKESVDKQEKEAGKETAKDWENTIIEGISSESHFIKIEDDKIVFPCKVADFYEIGFEAVITQEVQEKLKDSSQSSYAIYLEKDVPFLHSISLLVKPGDKDIKELEVIGFDIIGNSDSDIRFQFDNLVLYESDINDILEEFGTPEYPETLEEIDTSAYINTLSYDGGRLIFGTKDNKFSNVHYVFQ